MADHMAEYTEREEREEHAGSESRSEQERYTVQKSLVPAVWKTPGFWGILLVGILLIFLYIVTDAKSDTSDYESICQQALSLQEAADEMGFQNFTLSDYPLAIYDGTKDYVYYEGEITQREPVLETFAGTAYLVEDHFEVIVPAFDQMERLVSLVGGVESLVAGSGYEESNYLAMIWHEAFHAYQFSCFDVLGIGLFTEDLLTDADGTGQNAKTQAGTAAEEQSEKTTDEIIIEEIDEVTEIRAGLEAEMELLAVAVQTEDLDELMALVIRYEENRAQRLAQMSDEAIEAEVVSELTEGSAYYVEAYIYRVLEGQEAYEEGYLATLADYSGGNTKFYHTGMAKCLILDRLDPDWKETLDFSCGLDTLLLECVEQ